MIPPLLKDILEALDEKKGMDILALDVRSQVSYADHLVLCTATSPAHIHALVEQVKERTGKGRAPTYINSSKDDSWWILDFVEVVVHLFKEDVRRYYDLEQLWGDAPRVLWEGPDR